MKATSGAARRFGTSSRRLGAGSSAAAAALLLWTSVLAGPAEEAIGLCSIGDVYTTAGAGQLTKDSRLLFQAGYKYADWTGHLRAYGLTEGTLNVKWSAASIPLTDARSIFTWSGSKGVPFTVDGLKTVAGLAWPSAFGQGDNAEEQAAAVVAYLRGNQTGEDGAFRKRSSRLGAIVNSEIAYAGADNFGYEALDGEAGTKYKQFMQDKVKKLDKGTDQLVLVGANDGMLHGFDAASGTEKFAYVPRALLLDAIDPTPNPLPAGPATDPRSTLVRLADPNFTPRHYVDGSPWVGDAYWSGAWRTVVVGTAGAGGKSVFALDITDPGAVKVLWEIDGQANSSLGYAFGQPVIGRLNDGNFYAIFGNGREGQGQCAVLFLVRLDNGQVRTIPTATGACVNNGLGRPSLLDNQAAGQSGFRTTDYVYAGDLKGNVWKFNLTSADPGNWGVAFQDNKKVPLPLFTAKNADGQLQPITGAIEIGAAPPKVVQANDIARPAMLWFGTGRYLSSGDAADKSVQSMYGILDRGTGTINSPSDNGANSRSKLVAQTATVKGDKVGTVSANVIDYEASGNDEKRGWYIDLVRAGGEASGERMIGLPLFQGSQLVFPTVVPDVDPCLGTSWIFAVNPYTGGALEKGKKFFLGVTVADYDYIGSTVGIVRNLAYVGTGTSGYLYAAGASGKVQAEKVLRSQQDTTRGRVSWREIVK